LRFGIDFSLTKISKILFKKIQDSNEINGMEFSLLFSDKRGINKNF